MTAVLLFVTAIMLTLAEVFSRKERKLESVTALDAVIIGFFQLLAIFQAFPAPERPSVVG